MSKYTGGFQISKFSIEYYLTNEFVQIRLLIVDKAMVYKAECTVYRANIIYVIILNLY